VKFLVIQTAFIGDVILATALVEKLRSFFPGSQIDMLVRKDNEPLLENNPHLHQVIIWNKKQDKIRNLFKIISSVRQEKYDAVINVHRFFSSGLITALSGAKEKTGFRKNPLSIFFSRRIEHSVNGIHEVERNQKLIAHLTDVKPAMPRLYPSSTDDEATSKLKIDELGNRIKYICIAPASVWFTKQFPKEKWIEFIRLIPSDIKVYLLGAISDSQLCSDIQQQTTNNKQTANLAGKLTFLQTASLMRDALMNYSNDSAPLHIASAMNAPVTAIFCSTVPRFGFGPLSEKSSVAEIKYKLYCRPCGLHGYRKCPEGHFKCALEIDVTDLSSALQN
jgi:heptosyltransferase-2